MHVVGCLKFTEDKSSENRVYIPDERLIIATHVNAKAQSMKPAPLHQYSTETRGSKLTSQLHCNNQDVTRNRVLTSLQYQDARVETRVSISL